jgi:hypothetical protein
MNQLLIVTLAGALLAAPTELRAQTAGAGISEAGISAKAPVEPRFDLELEAGVEAEKALGLIAERVGHPLNVVWTGDSASVSLPALRLHQITVREFFAAVTAAGNEELKRGRPGYAFNEVEGALNVWTFSVIQAPAMMAGSMATGMMAGRPVGGMVTPPTRPGPGIPNPFGGPVATGYSSTPDPLTGALVTGTRAPSGNEPVILSAFGPMGAPLSAGSRSSQFFDLAMLLNDELTVNDLTTAIRTAWTAAGEGAEPPAEALRFHKETELLIATGTPEQLSVVQSIVDLLKARVQPSADAKDSENLALQSRLRSVTAESEDFRKRADQNAELADVQIAKLRERLAELEIELAKANARQ